MARKRRPKYRHADFGALCRAADGAKPHFYPIYKTSGRTFFERDKRGPKPGNN